MESQLLGRMQILLLQALAQYSCILKSLQLRIVLPSVGRIDVKEVQGFACRRSTRLVPTTPKIQIDTLAGWHRKLLT